MSSHNSKWDLLLDRLEANVAKYPKKLAVGYISPGPRGGSVSKQLTYEELAKETSSLASFLLESGLKKGDRYVRSMVGLKN
jgi:acyl-CoA synthetase (AMP-forming)/AMP-acid ligase II